MRFWKYQALGNDFIIVPGRSVGGKVSEEMPVSVVARICDRHFGVGADGILILELSDQADAKMIILNADGSRPEMCGNGIRCFVAHLGREIGAQSGTFSVETDAGVLGCRLSPGKSDGGVMVSVDMGPARLGAAYAHVDPAFYPTEEAMGALNPVRLPGYPWSFFMASMGNPHAVARVDDATIALGELVETQGPALSYHPAFTQQMNVEWVRVVDVEGVLDVAVHERGVGPTLACGTGACAVAAVAHRLGWVRGATEGEGVTVKLPGGPLSIVLHDTEGESDTIASVTMTGSAALVFEGRLEAAMLTERNVE